VKRRLIVLYEKLPSQIMQTGMSHQAEKTYWIVLPSFLFSTESMQSLRNVFLAFKLSGPGAVGAVQWWSNWKRNFSLAPFIAPDTQLVWSYHTSLVKCLLQRLRLMLVTSNRQGLILVAVWKYSLNMLWLERDIVQSSGYCYILFQC
jgi:hypothetical protein